MLLLVLGPLIKRYRTYRSSCCFLGICKSLKGCREVYSVSSDLLMCELASEKYSVQTVKWVQWGLRESPGCGKSSVSEVNGDLDLVLIFTCRLSQGRA